MSKIIRKKEKLVLAAISRRSKASLTDIVKEVKISDSRISINDVIHALDKGVQDGSIRETRGGSYMLIHPWEQEEELRDDHQQQCSPRRRRRRCATSSPCPAPTDCPGPEPEPCCPESFTQTFTKRCSALEKRLASESFEDICMLRSPAYLECFTEIINPEHKCRPAPDC